MCRIRIEPFRVSDRVHRDPPEKVRMRGDLSPGFVFRRWGAGVTGAR